MNGFRRLLAALGDDPAEGADVLELALGLAEGGRSRVTLVASAQRCWVSYLASGWATVPSYPCIGRELEWLAEQRLDDAAEHVPRDVSLVKLVVRTSLPRAVRTLAASGRYEVAVVGPRIGRRLRGLPVPVLVAPPPERPTEAPVGRPALRQRPA